MREEIKPGDNLGHFPAFPWSPGAVAQRERHTKRTLFEVFFTSNSLSSNAHLLSL
jgi:hypothetical protein